MLNTKKMRWVLDTFTFMIFISPIFGVKDEQWIDYRLILTQTPSSGNIMGQNMIAPSVESEKCEIECVAPELMCGSCRSICKCDYVDDELVADFVDNCKAPSTCNNGECSLDHSEECSPSSIPFACTMEGTYPDPFSCKKYHYCIENEHGDFEHYPRWCETDYAYNSYTTYCDKLLANDECVEVPVPYCMKLYQTAALEENPTLYYVCYPYRGIENALYPYLYQCPRDEVYDGYWSCKEVLHMNIN